MSQVIQRWSSRKFWSTMFWQLVNTVMLYLDKIPADTYEILTMALLGSYLAANVYQKKVEKARELD